MADIKGIELASETYGLEDETARNTATEASQSATEASQTATEASQMASENTQRIVDIENMIPSGAGPSNLLATVGGGTNKLNQVRWVSDDFNNAIPEGGPGLALFSVSSAASHVPNPGANYLVLVIGFDTSHIQQEAMQLGSNNRYIRNYSDGIWSDWLKIATE